MPIEPPRAAAVLQAERISKVYRTGEVDVHALSEVDFALYAGELVVLLGAPGSGKSTLFNILGGLDTPTSGRVLYHGGDLTEAGEAQLRAYRRHHVGFVFQFYNLIPSLTAEENLELVTDIVDTPMPAREALELVGLSELRDHFPVQLSDGDQQRVAIARAVAKRPQILLCDEPTGALDVRTGVRVLDVLRRVNRELGTCTAVITHNAAVGEMADRVFTLSAGRIQSERTNPRLKQAVKLRWWRR